ncbi:MAG: hypothetical protein HZB15_03655 [Actinobacteria bacterium]|nr:hypothetical protein [Actinomycetota bacterium]
MAEGNDGAGDDAVASDDELHDGPVGGEAAIIAAARRRHGSFGAVVAAGMLGFEKLLGRKPKEEAPIVVDAPTEPVDIDSDGITLAVDDLTTVVAPPLPRVAPTPTPTRRRRR